MKTGILYSDALNTVSKAYAREIQTPEFGWGLDGLLRERAAVLSGISRPDWATRTFAYAESWDPDERRYAGLAAGPGLSVSIRSPTAERHSTREVVPSCSGAYAPASDTVTIALPSLTARPVTLPAWAPLIHTGEPLVSCAADGMTSRTW